PGGDGDEQARYVEGRWSGARGKLRAASIYLPNGNPFGTDKFTYKLAFLERPCAASSISATPKPGAACTPTRPDTLSGTIRRAPGRRITACASTICCS